MRENPGKFPGPVPEKFLLRCIAVTMSPATGKTANGFLLPKIAGPKTIGSADLKPAIKKNVQKDPAVRSVTIVRIGRSAQLVQVRQFARIVLPEKFVPKEQVRESVAPFQADVIARPSQEREPAGQLMVGASAELKEVNLCADKFRTRKISVTMFLVSVVKLSLVETNAVISHTPSKNVVMRLNTRLNLTHV